METASRARSRREDTTPEQGEEEISFRRVALSILIMVSLVGIAASSSKESGAASQDVGAAASVAAPERCFHDRRGLEYYRVVVSYWRHKMGAGTVGAVRAERRSRRARASCPRIHVLAKRWKRKAIVHRQAFKRWTKQRLLERSLRDHGWWRKDVSEVQRVFPDTASWLMSCSAAEGGWGRWVGYGGQSYSPWLRDSDTVGGPMQFRYSTFKTMYRHALEYLGERGFYVPRHLREVSDTAWRSFLGQALAAGWARHTGNDNSHWSASWGRGC